MIPKFRAWEESAEEGLQMWSWKEMCEIGLGQLFNNPKYELMQYTGLKDKNSIEIFEGDIVKRTYLFSGGYGETHTGEVVYDEEYARYVISRPQKYIEPKTEDLRNVLSDKSTYEIIGNVHENPELLEVEE